MKNLLFFLQLSICFTFLNVVYAECDSNKEVDPSVIMSQSLSGLDICSQNGSFTIISSMLQDGIIYPLKINTNIEKGREQESKLRQLNERLALHIQNYCNSIDILNNETKSKVKCHYNGTPYSPLEEVEGYICSKSGQWVQK